MKPIVRSFASVLGPVFLATAFLAAPVAAQDKAKPAAKAEEKKAAPAKAGEKKELPAGTTKVLLDNEKFRVTEVRFKPGEGGPPRERQPRVVRALSDGTMERTYTDGKTEKVEWKTGQVRYLPKDNFGNRNIGKTDVVLYVVEPK
jgi:hypothetical protein